MSQNLDYPESVIFEIGDDNSTCSNIYGDAELLPNNDNGTDVLPTEATNDNFEETKQIDPLPLDTASANTVNPHNNNINLNEAADSIPLKSANKDNLEKPARKEVKPLKIITAPAEDVVLDVCSHHNIKVVDHKKEVISNHVDEENDSNNTSVSSVDTARTIDQTPLQPFNKKSKSASKPSKFKLEAEGKIAFHQSRKKSENNTSPPVPVSPPMRGDKSERLSTSTGQEEVKDGDIELDSAEDSRIVDDVCIDIIIENDELSDEQRTLSSKDHESLPYSPDDPCEIREIPMLVMRPNLPDAGSGTLFNPENCPICFDVCDTNNKGPALDCGHCFCKACVTEYLENKINLNRIREIYCAQEGCKNKYSDTQIQNIVTPMSFDKFQRFQKMNMVNQNQDLRWCIKPGCEKILKVIPGSSQITCDCGTTICSLCNNEFHGTLSCKSIIDKEFTRWAENREIIRCPTCKSGTEKSAGCNHMTCGVCGLEWCWLCKGEYTFDHYNTLNPFGCPGLQNGNHDRFNCNAFARCFLKFGVCLLWVVWILMVPLFLLGLSIIWPVMIYKKGRHHRQKNCFRVGFEGFWLILLGLITCPITFAVSLTLAIIPGSCIALTRLIKKRRMMKRRMQERRIENVLRNRELFHGLPHINPLVDH